jgi:hypothetical protein
MAHLKMIKKTNFVVRIVNMNIWNFKHPMKKISSDQSIVSKNIQSNDFGIYLPFSKQGISIE